MDHPVVLAILTTAGIVTALAVIWRQAIRPGHQVMRRFIDFLDDWNGSLPRPGRPRQEPMPDRLRKLEAHLREVTAKIERLYDDLREVTAKIERLYGESVADRNGIRARLARLEERHRRRRDSG